MAETDHYGGFQDGSHVASLQTVHLSMGRIYLTHRHCRSRGHGHAVASRTLLFAIIRSPGDPQTPACSDPREKASDPAPLLHAIERVQPDCVTRDIESALR